MIIIFFLFACAQPLPKEKYNYAGNWSGGGIDLMITEEGDGKYHRVKENGTKISLNGPVRFKENSDDFTVGFWFISSDFKVAKPPFQEGGAWKMVVDGVELVRAD